MVHRAKLLNACTLLMLGGGLACLGFGAADAFGTATRGSVTVLCGITLIFLGGGAGLLANVVLRRGCRELVVTSRKMATDGQVRLLDPPDSELKPLVAAVNECLAVAQSAVTDAGARRRELEIQLRIAQAERRHAEAIIDSIGDAVVVTDPFDEVVLANDAAARALGFDLARVQTGADGSEEPAETPRRPVEAILSDPVLINLIREVRKGHTTAGPRVLEHQIRSRTPAGRSGGGDGMRTFKVTLSPVGTSGGKAAEPAATVSGVVTVLRDMTWEKEVARMKNDFVSHVSHELRTPLASIKAYAEMLIDGEADDDKSRREFEEVILGEADRLGRLIDDILSISRIESGLAKIEKEAVSPVMLMKQSIEVMQPQAKAKKIEITEHLGPSIYQVRADRDMLYQAVLNLLSNAVKYTPAGGKVTVRLDVDEARHTLTGRVIDNGVGIPPKDLPHVFEKFYRVEANKKMANGTGLGLPLVKHVIESIHRGRIFVESEVGRGSCFGFELPLMN